jgi:excinuclease UvrABC helicase subunit UvrB
VRERVASYDKLDPRALVEVLEQEMREAADAMDFERAARLRDELFEVKAKLESRPTNRGAARSRLAALRPADRRS